MFRVWVFKTENQTVGSGRFERYLNLEPFGIFVTFLFAI